MSAKPARVDETTALLHTCKASIHSARTHLQRLDSQLLHQHLYSQSIRSMVASRKPSARQRMPGYSQDSTQHDTSLQSSLLRSRTWYDQFTSIDWLRDTIADADRVRALGTRTDSRGKLQALFDKPQGFILVAIIGILTAAMAYVIDVTESTVFDIKLGYCSSNWWHNKHKCCPHATTCDQWVRWSTLIGSHSETEDWADHVIFTIWVIALAMAACYLTLLTRTTISTNVITPSADEDLSATDMLKRAAVIDSTDSTDEHYTYKQTSARAYYPAAGSGVAEVKVILSGFILRGYLGIRTLVCKSVGLVFSVASGLSVGKEGPYVHIATCIGNITSRLFHKYNINDGKRRELLSASAAAGVAVAFGAPLGGVLFSLEEVSYYFPHKTLFRTFFCCIVATLSLKFLNPYGTNKVVLFEVRYLTDWKLIEMAAFALLGVLGGLTGALMIKSSRIWARTFSQLRMIKDRPATEVLIVATITGLLSFPNRYTRLPVVELLYELATPCDKLSDAGIGSCAVRDGIPSVLSNLLWALIIKYTLTVITFGIKVPAGIYLPSMAIGGLIGRIVGHSLQYIVLTYPAFADSIGCPLEGGSKSCIVPGVYAMVAAGATMCGVTRLSVTLAVIIFELSGSLEHVLPFSLGVLIAKWTADAIEPASIYDLLLSNYPYLDSSHKPIFTMELEDITPELTSDQVIDISDSGWIRASTLRSKLEHLHFVGELDGGIPIIQHGVLKGLFPAPDLEFALDGLELTMNDAMCYMDPHVPPSFYPDMHGMHAVSGPGSPSTMTSVVQADFSDSIDPAPMAVDIHSSIDLVFECFSKLGLRYICVLQDGQFVGLVHKKAFVKHVQDAREQERSRTARWH